MGILWAHTDIMGVGLSKASFGYIYRPLPPSSLPPFLLLTGPRREGVHHSLCSWQRWILLWLLCSWWLRLQYLYNCSRISWSESQTGWLRRAVCCKDGSDIQLQLKYIPWHRWLLGPLQPSCKSESESTVVSHVSTGPPHVSAQCTPHFWQSYGSCVYVLYVQMASHVIAHPWFLAHELVSSAHGH